MNLRKLLLFLALLFLGFALVSCSKISVDYSKTEHWLSLPTKPEKQVDVFYLYPTVWQKNKESDPVTCKIDNPEMLKNAKEVLEEQATAFETVGNIYAPYYRQVDMSILSLSREEQTKVLKRVPVKDVIAAFDYYIKHYNNGRPYILAGHSQGADVLLFLLSEYMKKNPEVYSRMIAAYVIGYSITKDYLAKNPHLKFAQGPNDVGVLVSYNTEAPGFKGDNPVLLPGAIAINPITWTREEKQATAMESLGSRLANEQGQNVLVKHYADARVDKSKGVVLCGSADVKKLSCHHKMLPDGIFHCYDVDLYYYDIRQNAENRAKRFLSI